MDIPGGKRTQQKIWEHGEQTVALLGSFDVCCKSGERSTEGEKSQQDTAMQTLTRHASIY